VWIEGCEGYCGYRTLLDAYDRDNPYALILMAGFSAERHWNLLEGERLFGDDFVYPEWDDEICAFDDVERAIAHLEGLHQELDRLGILALLQKYESEAKDLVVKLWPAIERLAGELVLKGKLSAVEAHAAAGYPRPGYLDELEPEEVDA
jgi:hypothetical protein